MVADRVQAECSDSSGAASRQTLPTLSSQNYNDQSNYDHACAEPLGSLLLQDLSNGSARSLVTINS